MVGFSVNSLALISDASHNLSDVASLVISLIGMKLAHKAATQLYTYGYKKASILASLKPAAIALPLAMFTGASSVRVWRMRVQSC